MTENTRTMRKRTLSLALGTSVLALGLGIASSARAQCAPDPTVAYGATMCAGTDNNGIRVTTAGTILQVLANATVTNTGAPPITVDVPRGGYNSIGNTVSILGSVSVTGQNAIAVTSGPLTGAPGGYSNEQINLIVGAGGSVTGATALSLLPSTGNANGTVTAMVDNAGTLTGTGGTALRGNVISTANGYTTAITSFAAITNRTGASIVGGILGPVSTLTNVGSIDGDTGSAIDSSAAFSPTVTNAAGGTIRSSSAAATVLAGASTALTVTNAGTITNAGNGPALSGGTVGIANQAGGQISTGGATAIVAATALSLVNAGTVTGNVTTGNGASTVDSTAGTINGSLTFGSGNDTLIARYTDTRTLATGVTGSIDAGGGTNTERVAFATDTSVTTPIDLNTGFQQLVLEPAVNVTATLQSGFATSTGLVVTGLGTVVNRAALSLTGTAVTDLDYAFGTVAAFRNEGSITTTTNNQAGINLSTHSLTNIGSIAVTGGTGVSMSYNPVVNSGSITASGTGVNIFDGVLTNSGAIVSTGGTGAYLFGNVGYTGSNSGTIRGATTGVDTYIYFTNTGTVGSAGTAVAVEPYGYLINAAGGVVNGGSRGAATISAFNAGIANAGTINGNVTDSGDGSTAYFALPGGTLNGDLAIGNGMLVTNLVNTGPGQFAGITGAVTASSGGTLRYAVNADATAVLAAGAVGPFATAGYQLANNAALTLTAPAGQTRTQTLLLAGTGSVVLAAAITTTNASAIQSTSAITYPGGTANTGPLSIVSDGSLTVTRTVNSAPYGAVLLRSTDSFTNAGTIAMTDRTGNVSAAISGGNGVTNAGTIVLSGAAGISGAAMVTNTGSIVQASGGAVSQGVTGFTTLNNQGTVQVGGNAVQIANYGNATAIINGGTLSSTGGPAISSGANSYGVVTINNLAGGTIAGVGQSIQTYAGVVTNAGTIDGDILLAAGADTVSNAGAIIGNVSLGAGDDIFVQHVGGTVSGLIDGGNGTDSYVVDTTGGSTSLVAANIANFERVTQSGTGTGSYSGSFGVDTINLAGGTLSVASGQTLATTGATTITSIAGSGTVSIVNAGTIAGGITLADGNDIVVNAGTIGGKVQLGAGDDTYVEGVGSIALGGVDGGGGTNLYRVVLNGDRTGIGARTNFQNLALDGTGTLGLALDQNYQTIALNGPSLSLTMGSHTVGQIVATSDMAARLSLDGQIGSVQLGAGNDVLTLMTSAAVSGTLDGGGGTDTLVLDGSGAGTLGSAQVVDFESGVKQGSGTWTLTGTAAASPTSWTISAGTLRAAGGNAISAASAVNIASGATFDLAGYSQAIGTLTGAGAVTLGAATLTVGGSNLDATFAGSIGGTGGFNKIGTGSINLTGTNIYTGPTTISGGRLAVNGSISSSVTVNAGGTLGGNGTVGSTTIMRGGTFAPGNSIGTTTVAGNVAFAAGSIYQVEANAAGQADRINTIGTATLTGGTVQVLAATGVYAPLTSYTILTATGGVNGRFASVTSNMAFLTPLLSYGANAVTLELGRNDIAFASQATTANGVAVANAIAARGLGDTVYNTILVQTATGAGHAFDQLSGEIHATIPTAMIDSDRRVREAILDRARVAQGDGPGIWIQGMDTYAYSRDQAQAFGFHTNRIGVYGGIDYAFGGLRVGISGGYLDDKLRVPALASRAEIETDIIGGSLSYAALGGRLNATAGATHAWHHVGTTRNVDVAGLASAYSAHYTVKTTQAFGELGFDLLQGPVALTPFVRYDYDWSRADGFNEVGGLAALDVAAERRHNAFGTAGARIAASYPIGNGLAIEPHASAAYLRTWDRLYSTRTETFGGTGPAFSVTGDRLGRNNLDANGGIDLVVSTHIRIGATGYVTRSNDIRDYGGKGSVSIRF